MDSRKGLGVDLERRGEGKKEVLRQKRNKGEEGREEGGEREE